MSREITIKKKQEKSLIIPSVPKEEVSISEDEEESKKYDEEQMRVETLGSYTKAGHIFKNDFVIKILNELGNIKEKLKFQISKLARSKKTIKNNDSNF